MAQMETSAGDAIESVDTGEPIDPVEAFADAIGLEEDGSDPERDEDEDEALEAEPEDEKADEPETPAIDAPVSWKADAKEAFSKLPREMQEVITARETERERFVQSKAQEAAQTRAAVESEARAAIAQLQQQTAAQLQQYAQAIEPQRPDPALIQYDPQGFYRAQAEYESALAQRTQAQQQAAYYQGQAQQQTAAIEQAQLRSEVETLHTAFPEWNDPNAGPDLQRKLTATAREIGYSDEHVTNARAVDILAMRKVSDIIAERDSLKAQVETLNKTKMTNVRAAKALPKVSRPGAAPAAPSQTARAESAWQNVRGARTVEQKNAAFADYLGL